MQVLPGYEYFWALLLIALLVPFLAFIISDFISPSSKSVEKKTTYESGIEPMGESWVQFQIRYYMFALVFVIFDVETVFLYPWAISFPELGLTAFIEALVFIIILVIGLIYAWRKGALEWS
jgi:NAD(P)H-quinone oxidoreductase subunit 3